MRVLNFRLAMNIPQSRILSINKKGQVEGLVQPVAQEAFRYFFAKLNLSWVHPDVNSKTSDDIASRGVRMIDRDEADGVFCAFPLNDGLPKNVTVMQTTLESVCRLGSSPIIRSEVLQDGPKTALLQTNMEYLSLILFGLFIMIYLAQFFGVQSSMVDSAWFLYANLLRQRVHFILEKFPLLILLLSVMLIQALFSSFLHTERTSITKFVKINSLSEANKYNVTTFVFSISSCPKLVGGDHKFEVLPIIGGTTSYRDLTWCIATGKCASLFNSLDFKIAMSLACSMYPERILPNPFYLSPPLRRILGGYFLNKRIPKNQRDRIKEYIQRSFEMGLEEKKGFLSKYVAARTVKQIVNLELNEECYSKKMRVSFSTPAALNGQFFKNCFILNLLIAISAIILHFFSQCSAKHCPKHN